MHIIKNELLVLVVLIGIALVSFLGIVTKINHTYGVEMPAFGGTLTEGIVGNPRFINPLLAQSDSDRSMTTLLYTGLMRYDATGALQPALLESYEVSEDGLVYTIILKEKLRWSNDKKLTADDVVFTINLAKNPLAQSPRRANWEGVEVSKIDDRTILFRLKKPYAPFLDNLTLGIVPKFLWEDVPPSQITLSKLNTDTPVGAGPYRITSIRRDALGSIISIKFVANKHFVLGRPHIKTFITNFYADETIAVKNLKNGIVDSLGGISPRFIEDFVDKKTIHEINLQRIIGIFFNQGSHPSLASLDVRRALNISIDKQALVAHALNNYGSPIDGPLPRNIAPEYHENYDPELSVSLIEKRADGLELTLTTAATPELIEIANFIKRMWESIGVSVNIQTFAVSDLEQLVIGPRRYDAFLYGEEVVGQNPDPFAFWHSSQRAHPGFNIALYANSKVDNLLESVRTAQDAETRNERYETIQKEIAKDVPAVFLFSPSYIYVAPKKLEGMKARSISTGSERFSTVHEWYLKKQFVWKIFTN